MQTCATATNTETRTTVMSTRITDVYVSIYTIVCTHPHPHPHNHTHTKRPVFYQQQLLGLEETEGGQLHLVHGRRKTSAQQRSKSFSSIRRETSCEYRQRMSGRASKRYCCLRMDRGIHFPFPRSARIERDVSALMKFLFFPCEISVLRALFPRRYF